MEKEKRKVKFENLKKEELDIIFTAFKDELEKTELDRLRMLSEQAIDAKGKVRVAYTGGTLVGFAISGSEGIGGKTEDLVLKYIYIAEEKRRNGIGKKLFDQVRSDAFVARAKRILISDLAEEDARAFFEKMGCVKIELTSSSIEEEQDNGSANYVCQIEDPSGNGMMYGMAIGMCFGMMFGQLLFENAAMGLAMGMCLGMSIGLCFDEAQKEKGKEDKKVE